MLRYRYWTRVSVSVNVLSPFVLDFVATLKDGVGKYSVKINDLEVRYTPCEKPSPQSKRVDDSPQSKGVDDEAKKRKLGWHKRCFSEPLGSISRSWSSLSRSSRISSPKPST
nr:PREDICTED: uncharacterized protein LOC109038657 [Bemisia tabaci]